MESVAHGDRSIAEQYLSEDFLLEGPTPEPINLDQWLGLHQIIRVGMPDFSFNISDVQVRGDVATVTMQIAGTHTGTLDLSPLGLPTVPATGKRVRLPVEHPRITFNGDEIVSAYMEVPPGGGVMGMLEQLGVDLR